MFSLQQLNLNLLRVFSIVYRTQSMTMAARRLHITQSGVSQHIRSLEEYLDIKLFDRIQQRLVPTAPAKILFEQCDQVMTQLESVVDVLRGEQNDLRGVINIGMPIEFGNSQIIPRLSQFAEKHPYVQFKITLGFASGMNTDLLKGTLDFAFVDDFPMDKGIQKEDVVNERLNLCIRADKVPSQQKKKQDRKFFESLPYVDYEEGAPLLRQWFHFHFGSREFHITPRAIVMDVQGVMKFVMGGMGAGILPDYLLPTLKKTGVDIYQIPGSGKPMMNLISVAFLKGRTQSPAAKSCMDFLLSELKKVKIT